MKVIKIIDLLNKRANNEELPKQFKYKKRLYELQKDKDYFCHEINAWFSTAVLEFDNLNDEIEIDENKKIEKLVLEMGSIEDKLFLAKFITHNRYKINEIIDVINGGSNEK